MEKHYRMQLLYGVVVVLAILMTFTSSTYAWFTFSSDTNVEPLEGGIGYGEGNLLIANDPEGPFSDYCELHVLDETVLLRPLSTADLQTFHAAGEQNRSGITVTFSRDDNYTASALCGTVYLKSELADSGVYFDPGALDLGSDDQALAAMRLGLTFTSSYGVTTHIFRLDALGNTANAQSRQTILQPGCVVASVDAAGRPDFVPDPAADLSGYFAGGDGEDLIPGAQMLCVLPADEAVRVDYVVYLEGCDEHCINAVQGRDLALSLGFSGIGMSDITG